MYDVWDIRTQTLVGRGVTLGQLDVISARLAPYLVAQDIFTTRFYTQICRSTRGGRRWEWVTVNDGLIKNRIETIILQSLVSSTVPQ